MGLSGWPAALAGQTDSQRPHWMQASKPTSRFQAKSPIVPAPSCGAARSSGAQIGDGARRAEAGGAGMDDEMQGPGHHMLQRTAGDLRGQSQKQQGGQDLARRHGARSFGQEAHLGEGDGGGDQREEQQQEGQHLETPAGEPAAASADSAGGRPAASRR